MGTELTFKIHVNVNDEKATTIGEWFDTNNGDAKLTIHLDEDNHQINDITSPKAHLEGYPIFTEAVGPGTIDDGRDVREGGSCTIKYRPNSSGKLEKVIVQKVEMGVDGNPVPVGDPAVYSGESLTQYMESYPLTNRISVLFLRTKFKTNMEDTLGAARPQFRSLNQRKSYGHCLFRLISARTEHPPQAAVRASSLDPQMAIFLCWDRQSSSACRAGVPSQSCAFLQVSAGTMLIHSVKFLSAIELLCRIHHTMAYIFKIRYAGDAAVLLGGQAGGGAGKAYDLGQFFFR